MRKLTAQKQAEYIVGSVFIAFMLVMGAYVWHTMGVLR